MSRRRSNEADYIVVGSGSSGSIVASRLAHRGHSVILLEAGGTDNRYVVSKPGMTGPMHMVDYFKSSLDWGFKSTPQEHMDGRVMPATRGKVVGGTSSVNGMVYVRGNRANFDSWAAEGNTGWTADDVNDAYRSIEDFEDGENEYRGVGGPLRITRPPAPQEATLKFLEATSAALGVEKNPDYNAASQEGISIVQQNIDRGIRMSSSRAFIHRMKAPSLELQTRVHVLRVVLEGTRAVGVEVRDADGTIRTIRAGKEIVLAAGFIGSPQILMLSGIGPARHLSERGIPVVADLPVGDNLQDHLFHSITYLSSAVKRRANVPYYVQGGMRDVFGLSSFLHNSMFESVGFVRSSMASDVPDLQFHMLPWAYPKPKPGDPTKRITDPRPSISVFSTLIYPGSRGTVRLKSSNPLDAPLIDYNYFSDSADVELLAEGTETLREILRRPEFENTLTGETDPGSDLHGADLRTALKRRAISVFHGVGTCRMGIDAQAVVTPDLKVRGIEGLRVADASIMPTITGGNTNAPSFMIGERAASMIMAGAAA